MASGTCSDLLEGYLCPICVIKFTTLEYLLEHYSEHKRNERKFRFSRLFAFRTFSKQSLHKKRQDSRLTVHQSSSLESDATTELQVKFDSEFDISIISNDADNVIIRSHSDNFKEYRAAHIKRHGKEQDRYLAKLMALSSGNNKGKLALWRRFMEVMDVDNENSTLSNSCSGCEKPFDVFRWKHTCKICEVLICEACSTFFKKQDALTLISPEEDRNSELFIREASRSSTTNTDNIHNTKKTELRLCGNCILLLKFIEARRKTEENIRRLVEVYTKVHDSKVLTENNMVIYKEVYRSLLAGETLYTLSDAVNLTDNIRKFAMELTTLQQFFSGPNGFSDRLHIAICRAVKDFLTEVWLLPKLPTQDKIEEAQRARFLALSARYRADRINNADDDFIFI